MSSTKTSNAPGTIAFLERAVTRALSATKHKLTRTPTSSVEPKYELSRTQTLDGGRVFSVITTKMSGGKTPSYEAYLVSAQSVDAETLVIRELSPELAAAKTGENASVYDSALGAFQTHQLFIKQFAIESDEERIVIELGGLVPKFSRVYALSCDYFLVEG